jgi:ubiquinone/menaquinone biosynthesis C-methylase UbiE
VIVTHHSDLVLTGSLVARQAAELARWSGVVAGRLSNRLVTYTHDRAAVSPTVTRAGKKVTIIPPPVTIEATSPERAQAFREQWSLGDGPVVGFAGRFAIEKGIDVLLKAVRNLRESWPGVVCVLAGPDSALDGTPWTGPWDPLIEELGPAVRKAGTLHGQDLADFYAACDVLVLPSINWTETFGLVQVEAMLCGTPVVASDLPGVREPALLTGMGLVATPGDVLSLTDSIRTVLADPERFHKPASEIARTFSLDVTVDAYERLYRGEVVDLQRPGPWVGTAPKAADAAETSPATDRARAVVRAVMPVEGDLAFRRRCETIVEWLEPQPGERVLDSGCGYGFTLRVLAQVTEADLVGIDVSQDRVDATRRDLSGFPRVCVMQGDSQQLPFDDNSFDHAVCSEVLEHLPDDAQAVRELARVVRPGGRIVITVPAADFPFSWDPPNWVLKRLGGAQLKGERPWSGIWYGHRRLYRFTDLRSLVEGAGLEVVEERGLTSRTPPFAHFLLYGVGKPLLQSGLLPQRLRRQADRMSDKPVKPRGIAGKAMGVLNRIDAVNDDAEAQANAKEFVALAVLARKVSSP